jgi:PadR family transcriptional regulator PadR
MKDRVPAIMKFIEGSEFGASGAEISKALRISSGTLYPVLMRLEGAGLLKSHWAYGDPAVRPRKRIYKVA